MCMSFLKCEEYSSLSKVSCICSNFLYTLVKAFILNLGIL